jgi:hypothetical protein
MAIRKDEFPERQAIESHSRNLILVTSINSFIVLSIIISSAGSSTSISSSETSSHSCSPSASSPLGVSTMTILVTFTPLLLHAPVSCSIKAASASESRKDGKVFQVDLWFVPYPAMLL